MTNTQATLDFISHYCKDCNIEPTWAALSVADLKPFHTVRQIRKVKNLLAVAYEPILGNYIVLRQDQSIVLLSREELRVLDN